MKDYQVMPELTAEEYAELKADIAERGVMVPIEFDEDGNILDGYHRYQICQELGITDYPKVIRAGMTEQEKLTHARKLNIARRHLTQEQLDRITKDEIKADPLKPDSQIANDIGVSDKTVTKARREMESVSEIPKLDTRIGKDGKVYPAHRQRKPVSVFNPSNRDADALKDPDIQRRLAENEGMNVAGAIREQSIDNLVAHLEDPDVKREKELRGVYDVVIVDPPETMSLDELRAIKLPAHDICHVFLWTDGGHLPEMLDTMKAWNVKRVLSFICEKPEEKQKRIYDTPFIDDHYHILYGHIGSPQFVDQKQFWAYVEGGPEGFYKVIRRVTAGRRAIMFGETEVEGYDLIG